MFSNLRGRTFLVVIWIVFTLALTGWWMIFGLKQLEFLSNLQPSVAHDQFVRHQKMLLYEGSTLLLLLFVGGAALAILSIRDWRRARQIKDFFATFTHELKTSLASVRLQAESLQEDLAKTEHSKLLERLLNDTVRLELQLENSLFLARPDESQLFLEKKSVRKIVQTLQIQWPQLKFMMNGDAEVLVDQRLFESILKNIIHNAKVHGDASEIQVSCTVSESVATICIADNGKGFLGNYDQLGEMFQRQNSKSGTGIGLALAMRLTKMLKGTLSFVPQSVGFAVELKLPRAQGGEA